MDLNGYSTLIQPGVEADLKLMVDQIDSPGVGELHRMLAYHLGWEGEGAGPEATGKRIRPLLTLLSAASSEIDWKAALPAASAVELVHNFSLLHDDIQDNSDTRRGRPTVWKLWGVPQAINAGDAMFSLAFQSILRLEGTVSNKIAVEAAGILQNACIRLTHGQYLDLSYERRADLTLEDYWRMVSGKTAALIGACTELGAVAANCGQEQRKAYWQFGNLLGLAFQAQDDLLGIWGDEELTGKSSASDLAAGKKSLPVVYGLEQGGDFKKRWLEGPVHPAEVPEVAHLLEESGAKAYTETQADRLTREALDWLERAAPQGDAGAALRVLALKLLKRKM